MSTFRWDDGIEEELRMDAAKLLLVCAITLQTEHMKDLNKSNPRPYLTPSRPGEFPRKRTGNLQAGILIEPSSLSEIADTLRVRVGYSANANYGAFLADKGWLWLEDTADRIAGRLATLSGGAVSGKVG